MQKFSVQIGKTTKIINLKGNFRRKESLAQIKEGEKYRTISHH